MRYHEVGSDAGEEAMPLTEDVIDLEQLMTKD